MSLQVFRALNLLSRGKLAEPNLMPFQKAILTWLKPHKSWIITNTDKNLWPCGLGLNQYISDVLVCLNDESTYDKLTEEEAKAEGQRFFREILRLTFISKANGRGEIHLQTHVSKFRRPIWILLPALQSSQSASPRQTCSH